MEASIRKTDGVIVQVGNSLGALDDCEIVELTAEQAATVEQGRGGGGLLLASDGTITVLPIPTPVAVPDPDAELDAAITAATTFAQLKAALLAGGGRVKARPRE